MHVFCPCHNLLPIESRYDFGLAKSPLNNDAWETDKKSGNNKLVNVAYNIHKKLNKDILFKAHILKISRDRALINAGRQSGVKLKDNLIILRKKDYPIEFLRTDFIYTKDDIKGSGIVMKVDENISEIKFIDDDFFKDVDIDDIVIYKK